MMTFQKVNKARIVIKLYYVGSLSFCLARGNEILGDAQPQDILETYLSAQPSFSCKRSK